VKYDACVFVVWVKVVVVVHTMKAYGVEV
jgi:hypothetical protein